jgi:peptidoglycan hydrolase-like protein with peptidoglycan-binding domain
MQNRAVILNELREISPVVADAGSQNPYQVPTGYFEGLLGQLLQRIKAGEDEVSPVLKGAYSNPFTVPQGYFENLAETILKRIKAESTDSAGEELAILSPLLKQLGKKTPFSTPDGYFEELTENAVSGAKAIEFVNEELENLSPVLSGLQNKEVYTVPAGYFESLSAIVLEKAKAQRPARVVKMNFTQRVVRYAAAAVIAGGLIVGGWFYLGNSKGASAVDGNGVLADIPKPIADSLNNISEQGLENYLENQNDATADAPIANNVDNDIKPSDMKTMLADVSDDELQQYLEQYGNGNPIQTTTN